MLNGHFLTLVGRIVVQALPPFIVVHTNAAYSHLTGNDAHTVAGKPVSSVFSLLEFSSTSSKQSADDKETKGELSTSGELAQAAAAGRAKAQATGSTRSPKFVGLARLVQTNSFGRLHLAQVSAKSHTMVGRNVSFVRGDGKVDNPKPEPVRQRDESSNDTSLTNSFGDGQSILTCRASIAPVVSSPEMINDSYDHNAPSARSKRKKLALSEEQDGQKTAYATVNEASSRSALSPRSHLVTHYVIQLQLHDGSSIKHESNESLSSNSTSIEARNLGITKAELRSRRNIQSETSDSREVVATVG